MRYKFRYKVKEGVLELEWGETVRNAILYKERRVITERYWLSERQSKVIEALIDNEAHNVRVIASRVYGSVNKISITKVKLMIELINKKIERSRIKGEGKGLKGLKVIQDVGRKQIPNRRSNRGRVETSHSIGEKRAKRATRSERREKPIRRKINGRRKWQERRFMERTER